MSPRRLSWTALIVLVLLWGGCAEDQAGREGAVGEGDPDAVATSSQEVELFFPSEGGFLRRERHELAAAEDVAGRIRQLVEALLAGPEDDGLFAPLPSEVELVAVQFTAAGIAYLDFETVDRGEAPPFGSRGELLAVYSIVDSVLVNVPQARAVVLLWNGEQRFSLAGHVDTAHPLTANLNLVVGE